MEYRCDSPSASGIGGASAQGPWFNGDGTWNSLGKFTVDGSVAYPQANVKMKLSKTKVTITGNGLPVNGTTGVFRSRPDR